MLNFFKNLFGSGETENHANGSGNGNGYAPTAAPAPAAPVPVQARTIPQVRTNPAVAPRPMAAAPMAGGGNAVQIPFHTIVAILPLEFKTRICQTMVSDIYVTLPAERVLSQLGSGSVRITFAELKVLVPNVFTEARDLDGQEIPLPLNEILRQINPTLLPRRQAQRQVQVPDEVSGPFGKDFAGVTLADPRAGARPVSGAPAQPVPSHETRMTPAPAAPAPMMNPAPASPIRMNPIPTNPIPTNAIPANPIPMNPPAAARPAQPQQPLKPAQPIPFRPPTPVPARPAPAAPAPAPVPESDSIPMVPFRSNIPSAPTPRPPAATPTVPPVRPMVPSARGVGATPTPMPSMAPTPMTPTLRMPAAPSNGGVRPTFAPPVPPAPIPAAPIAPAAQEACLNVPLRVFCESWPDVLRNEIVQLNLAEAQLALPVRFIEPALKQGKVIFSWKVLRSWVCPALPPFNSAHDGMMLELPLRILAPLFLNRNKQAVPQRAEVEVDQNIPNLFFGFPQGDAEEEEAQEEQMMPPQQPIARAPMPAPVPVSEANYTPAPKQTKVADTNFYVWNENGAAQVDETEFKKKPSSIGTDFLTRYATPNEVVARAAALDGVAGALVALPDGLMVASKLSTDLNGDTLAAFLPHIFGKVSQCTKELRMGELNNLHFTVGNVPWKIFRVNAIFFAVFGHAGQPLPTANLAALAGELDRKK